MREYLRGLAEEQRKLMDLVRDLNLQYIQEGVNAVDMLQTRAHDMRDATKRVEKLESTIESAQKKLRKAEGEKKADLAETLRCAKSAMCEDGAKTRATLDKLCNDVCSWPLRMTDASYQAIEEHSKKVERLLQDLKEPCDKASKVLGERDGRYGKPIVVAVSKDDAAADASAAASDGEPKEVLPGPIIDGLGEISDMDKKQDIRIKYLEKFREKLLSEAAKPKSAIPTARVEAIFDKLDALAGIHETLYGSTISFSPDKCCLRERDVLGSLADLYEPNLALLEKAHVQYQEHVGIAVSELHQLMKTKAAASVVRGCEKQRVVYGMYSLEQLLTMPCRYAKQLELCLETILSASNAEDPEWERFYHVVGRVKTVAQRVEQATEATQMMTAVHDLEARMEENDHVLTEVGRRFISEDVMECSTYMSGSNKGALLGRGNVDLVEGEMYHVLLFNDMVMIAKKTLASGIKAVVSLFGEGNLRLHFMYPISSVYVMVLPAEDGGDSKIRMALGDAVAVWTHGTEHMCTEWVDKFKEAQEAWKTTQVFGVAPEDLMARSFDKEDAVIPHVIADPLECVLKRGLRSEGIFRISASARTMNTLRLRINLGYPVEYTEPFLAAVMAKQWIASMPVPLLLPHLYKDWVAAARIEDDAEAVKALQGVVKRMPKMHKLIFYYICDVCRRVVANEASTKMTYKSLSIVFVPAAMREPGDADIGSGAGKADAFMRILALSADIFPGVEEEIAEIKARDDGYKKRIAERRKEEMESFRRSLISKGVGDDDEDEDKVGVSAEEWLERHKKEQEAAEEEERRKEEEEKKRKEEEEEKKRKEEEEKKRKEEEEKKRKEEEEKRHIEEVKKQAMADAEAEYKAREAKTAALLAKEEAKTDAEDAKRREKLAEEKKQLETKRKALATEAAKLLEEDEEDEEDEEICAGCGEPIEDDDEDAFEALDHIYHADCFKCVRCGTALGDNFKSKSNKPFCTKCYGVLFHPLCRYCMKPIDGPVLKACGETWHKEHFCCVKCGGTITDGNFSQDKDGNPICC